MSAEDGFELDRFQLDAIAALDRGRSVLVAAPTGSGKTVVAEAAIELAIRSGGKVFYTTPIKALSNQKFSDLRRTLGSSRVGLLTGDNAVNGDAPVVVMTTEVLRNMIYAGSSTLEGLHYVILDEVHYLQDAYRGPVWEEVIIHLPPDVRLVCLSATVSNADELGEWISTVRGPTETVIETERPVELTTWYMVSDRQERDDHFIPILVDGRANPEGRAFTEDPRALRRRGGRPVRRFATPRRIETVERLKEEDFLPAIYFIFSRNACDDALAACRDAGMRFTNAEERRRIRTIVEERTSAISDADLGLLGYDLWLAALEQGVAAHHAGMVPAFKESVEACFTEGLIRVVFATETLALGINMPARSVVIEKLTKYNGEGHDFLTAGEFTQLTGRAGRRGIDDEGHAVVLWSPFVSFDQVATLAASRTFPLTSSFRATYNMAANLVRRYERERAMEILGMSFAQFQADRALVGLQRRLVDDRARQERLGESASCELGDVESYAAVVKRHAKAQRDHPDGRRAVEKAMSMVRPGDLVDLPSGPAIVISVAYRGKGALRMRAVDRSGETHLLTPADLDQPPHPLGFAPLPTPFSPGEPWFTDACAELVGAAPPNRSARRSRERSAKMVALEAELAAHPVHRCRDRASHLVALADLARLNGEMEGLRAALAKRQGSVVRRFEAVIDLMAKWGFLEGWSLTRSGRLLASLYHECDLLLVEAIMAGHLDGLDAPALAAVVSCFTYEERRQDAPKLPAMPTPEVADRIASVARVCERLQRAERSRGLPQTRLPDGGFADVVYRWADGLDLGDVLDQDVSAGDFVRNIKVLIDLLRQVAVVAPDARTRATAERAADALGRGVVATSSDLAALAEPEVG